jgi:2-keto-myo-inositol isomerase
LTALLASFALNHMVAPQLGLRDFFALARRTGISDVEIRNDITGKPIIDGTTAATVRSEAEAAGVRIITINALQRFNQWTDERAAEAKALIQYARDCGSAALILVPVNDGSGRGEGERQGNLRVALKALKPMLEDAGITGLVEPLGFEICSLSSKREAAGAILAVGGEGVFRLTHDTFHHHLAGEPELFPQLTGLVHISGVSDPDISVPDMRDEHRVLVDAADRIGNVVQIAALLARGYRGPFSFEPFAAELREQADPAAAIGKSIDFIRATLAEKAA